MKLILASSSPRRKQLLEQAGYNFIVDCPDDSAESTGNLKLSSLELVAALAFQKAHDVAKRTDSGLILAADTVAECQGKVIGKPVDRDDAARILRELSGTTHYVHTGVCLWNRPSDRKSIRTDTTVLTMAELKDEQLHEYLESGLWQGKAGAFGYQDDLDWVTLQKGSVSNVVGLPMELLAEMLSQPWVKNG